MKLICEQLNPHSCKSYLLGMKGCNDIVLIDPVINHIKDYIKLVKDRKLHVSTIIDTHTHADHISGAASLKDIFKCDYLMYKDAPAKCVSLRVTDGFEWLLFDKIPVKVLHTPGHTLDSISLEFPDCIFTGDALFLDDGGAGRDDLPGGDPAMHWETLKKFYTLPEHLIVYPAHDYRNRQPSPLKQQKETNPHLKKAQEGKAAFVKYLDGLKLGPAEWMKEVLKANYACTRDPKAAWIPEESHACEVQGITPPGANEVAVATITPEILREKIKSAKSPVLLDVREKEELSGPLGHIENIIHIPVGSLEKELHKIEQYKDTEIVTICRSGGRATRAAQMLSKAGFKKAAVLLGGMQGWVGKS